MLKEIIEKIKLQTIIDDITECWLYQGALSDGYGIISFNGNIFKIHRVSIAYTLNLDILEKWQANHKNICPNRNCWNPEHLYAGTQADNIQDKQQTNKGVHGLWGKALSESSTICCPRGHEYTKENTQYQITKTGRKRKCRECARMKKNKSGIKRKLVLGNHYKNRKKN